MREYPVIFTAENAAKVRAGSKTMTRRVVKLKEGQEDRVYLLRGQLMDPRTGPIRDPWGFVPPQLADSAEKLEGVPVRLWVREPWDYFGGNEYLYQQEPGAVIYKADDCFGERSRWRNAMFMPRWASRTLLEVVNIRVERLQDISEEDAKAEGAPLGYPECDHPRFSCKDIGCWGNETSYRRGFCDLWGEINGAKAPWSSNPWVRAITFKRID